MMPLLPGSPAAAPGPATAGPVPALQTAAALAHRPAARPRRYASIRWKLTVVTMLASSAALLSASAAFVVYDVITFRQRIVRRLSTVAEIIAYNSSSAIVFRDDQAAAQTLSALKAEPRVVAAAIYAIEGHRFARYLREGAEDRMPETESAPLQAGHRFEADRLLVFQPVTLQGTSLGSVLIVADLREMTERVRRIALIVALVSLGAFGISLLISSRLQETIVGPVLGLARVAQVVSREKDYSVRAGRSGEGELGLLVDTFNDMLAEIQKRDQELNEARKDLERRVEERTGDLQRTQVLLAEAQRLARIGNWEWDLASNALWWSDEMYRLHGLLREEFTTTPEAVLALIDPADREGFAGELENARRAGRDFEFEYRIRTKRGASRALHVYGRVSLDDSGQAARIVGAAQDVTERREAEEQILMLNEDLARRAQDLETANRELESFSYSVSHDLRAPLRAIDGFSLALLEDYGSRLDEQGHGHLQRVRRATQTMGLLIDDLLKLARVARTELRREEVDLSALAGEVVAGLREADPGRAVEFVSRPGLTASGDGRLFKVLLENLLGNAWKFTSKQPQARIELGATPGADGLVYFVRDDGVGFDMTYADKLFGAFQRLHSPRDFPGTGIGLATCARIVHRHGGRIWPESAPGQGTTFFFTFEGSEA
jgi:PAS domain S-box-containing protein